MSDPRLDAVARECIEWALATFPDETIRQQALHLVKECGELESRPEGDEFADVYMLAVVIAHRTATVAAALGYDLALALQAKLATNRGRQWVRSPEGDYQHIKEPRT